MLFGLDLSHAQHAVDWALVKRAGARFAFYQATGFSSTSSEVSIDPQLGNNAAGSASHRVHAAPYHAFSSHLPGEYQAVAFIETVRDLPFSLAPALALTASSLHGRELCDQVLAFLLRVEDAFKIKPIIFSSAAFWWKFMISGQLSNVLPFAPYKLWQSHLGFSFPRPFYPFAGPSFWQFSKTARVPGVPVPTNQDYFLGDDIALLQFFCLNRYKDNPFHTTQGAA